MKQRRFIRRLRATARVTPTILLAALLLGLVAAPTKAASRTTRQTAHRLASTSIDATIYIATGTLEPIFQGHIDEAVPGAVNSAITNIVGKLPKQDQGWAAQMATTLIQPSVVLTGLTPQKDGMATSLHLSLYPGDPKPINSDMLVTFSVADSSTVQVSVQPLNGSPALVTGPLTTFQIPIGQLNSISTTPDCGNAALAMNLQVPITLAQNALQAHIQSSALAIPAIPQKSTKGPSSSVDSYVEIPASSLAQLGNSIGSLPVSSNMTAKNIQVSVSGSNLAIDSDIFIGSFKLGTAHTTVEPTASNGNLAVHVLSTTLTVFSIFTFPYNTYNAQIEQTLNSKLNGALTGKFYVNEAAIGPNSSVPCTASDSLLLTGTTSLG